MAGANEVGADTLQRLGIGRLAHCAEIRPVNHFAIVDEQVGEFGRVVHVQMESVVKHQAANVFRID